MKKITLLTKIIFHICNTGLIFLYLYPGSIMGWIIYKDFQKQPQITSDFFTISSNHAYAFIILSLLGVVSFNKNKMAIFTKVPKSYNLTYICCTCHFSWNLV